MTKFYSIQQIEVFDYKAFRAARKKAKITMTALAKEAGTSTAYICDLEQGRRGILKETAERLIAALERLSA